MENSSYTTLVILAAGMSSRFGRLKQLEPVGPNGETLLEFTIYDAMKAGVRTVILVIREEIEDKMKSYFLSKKFEQLSIKFVIQPNPKNRDKPYGTAHAILSVKDHVDGNFIVANADDYYGREAFLYAEYFFLNNTITSTYAMVPYVLNETLSENGTVNRGICKIDQHRILQNIEERNSVQMNENGISSNTPNIGKKREDNDALVSMNLWALRPSIFPIVETAFAEFLSNYEDHQVIEFQFPTIINQLIKENKISVVVLEKGKNWFGFTYPQEKESVQSKLKEKAELGEYPTPLFKSYFENK